METILLFPCLIQYHNENDEQLLLLGTVKERMIDPFQLFFGAGNKNDTTVSIF
jgi:hypothetical protein